MIPEGATWLGHSPDLPFPLVQAGLYFLKPPGGRLPPPPFPTHSGHQKPGWAEGPLAPGLLILSHSQLDGWSQAWGLS